MASKKVTAPTLAPTPNGHGPRAERHYQWLPVPNYPGFEVKGWVNASQRIRLDLGSQDLERINAAVLQIIVETKTVYEGQTYDTWFDCDGDPMPKPGEPGFLDAVPTELMMAALRTIRVDGPFVSERSPMGKSAVSASGSA